MQYKILLTLPEKIYIVAINCKCKCFWFGLIIVILFCLAVAVIVVSSICECLNFFFATNFFSALFFLLFLFLGFFEHKFYLAIVVFCSYCTVWISVFAYFFAVDAALDSLLFSSICMYIHTSTYLPTRIALLFLSPAATIGLVHKLPAISASCRFFTQRLALIEVGNLDVVR